MAQIEKFREWALKSGFPFENDVLIGINECFPTSKVVRNIEFPAPNEEGKTSIRSIDFAVSISKPLRNIPHRDWRRGANESAEIHFLIDCKYSLDESLLFNPSTRPIPISDRSWPHLIPTLTKNEFGIESSLHRQDLAALAKLDTNLKVAGNGRKVKEQSKERDSVASALLQVLQGSVHFIRERATSLGQTSTVDSSYERNAYFFIPIIVTNAPILLMHDTTTVNAVKESQNKEDIFLELQSILVEAPDIFDFKDSWKELKGVLSSSHRSNLGWLETGLQDGQVLFCNIAGLKIFLGAIHKSFEALQLEGR